MCTAHRPTWRLARNVGKTSLIGDVAVITKVDLAEAVGCDVLAIRSNIQHVRPGMEIFEVSAQTGAGLDELRRFLISRPARLEASQAV